MRQRVRTASYPASPGAYVLWETADCTAALYVGKAATQTIARRWRQHRANRAGSSALRRSLGVHLKLVEQKLRLPARYYEPSVEAEITRYLDGCYVEFFPTDSVESATATESNLIKGLNPRLNVHR